MKKPYLLQRIHDDLVDRVVECFNFDIDKGLLLGLLLLHYYYRDMKFRKYLAALTKTTEVGRYVIGNSSADYDSFFGSIILAYFLTATTGSVHLPLIDCLQKELPLRFEIMQVLHRLKIDHSIFTYR